MRSLRFRNISKSCHSVESEVDRVLRLHLRGALLCPDKICPTVGILRHLFYDKEGKRKEGN